jgi:hypothetical protein
VTAVISNGVLTVSAANGSPALFTVSVKAAEDGISLTRPFHFAFNGSTTAIATVSHEEVTTSTPVVYDLQGQRINQPTAKGVYIQNRKKIVIN